MHRLLKRQLRRIYGDSFDLQALSDDEQKLIETINTSYTDYDEERSFLEHILEQNSQELNKRNHDILLTLEKLETANKTLDEERGNLASLVEKRVSELNKAKEVAEKANHAKSEFLSRMSHELRTPLNAIIGFSDLMRYQDPDDKESYKTEIAYIYQSGKHLLSLIEDILDLSRIESGNMAISMMPVDLEKLLKECFTLMLPLAQENNIRLSFNTEEVCTVEADYTRLKQVIVNLLSNAVKYNREDGHVELSTNILHGEKIRISVTDTGPGIDPAQQENLFQPFERLGAEKGMIPGTGIGLTISRQLVELMGGTIGFESIEGGGSKFWIEINVDPDSQFLIQGDSGEISTITEGMTNKTLVYIEDKQSNLHLVEKIITSMTDYEYYFAENGLDGLKLIEEKKPDLTLLDINLPDISGFEVLERLKSNEATRDLPVVAVTANAMPDDIEAMKQAGFSNYCSKPFDIKKFLKVIEALI